MSSIFDVTRTFIDQALGSFFTAKLEAERRPGFEILPDMIYHTASQSTYILIKRDQLIKRVALPIIVGLAAGFLTSALKGRSVRGWIGNFAIDSVLFSSLGMIEWYIPQKNKHRGWIVPMVLIAFLCAKIALDKWHNKGLYFTAHCTHSISLVCISRVAIHLANEYKWSKKESFLRDNMIWNVTSMALILPINLLFKTRLAYSFKTLGLNFVFTSLSAFFLFSPRSPIVRWYAPRRV